MNQPGRRLAHDSDPILQRSQMTRSAMSGHPECYHSPRAVIVERSCVQGMMIVSPAELSSSEAERLRAFERQGHDALANSYHAFFAAVTALATNSLLNEVHLHPGAR